MGAKVQESGESSNSAESPQRNKKKSGSQYDCEVTCLDGTVIKTAVEKSEKGEVLFNKVVNDLDLTSKEYVGLLFKHDEKTWLDIHKNLKHQIGDSNPDFHFRVKFYEPEPAKLQDDYTRYLLYMQVREDLREKRLVCSDEISALLGSYTAQAELGDFNLSEHEHNYLDGYDFAENEEVLKAVKKNHKEHRGQTPAEAEANFLEVAKKIPRYGVDVHVATDTDGPVEIGIAPLGIIIYRDGDRESLYRWQNMRDFLYNRRNFTVKLKEPVNENDKKTIVYVLESAKQCKQCYKAAVEYHTFYRLTRPDAPRKRMDSLKLGSSFRYSDRTLYQLRQSNMNDAPKETPKFQRTPSKRRTMPASHKLPELVEPEVPYVDPSKNVPQEIEEEPIRYEEIEIDEANPEDEKYDPKEWETVEKTLPDGSKKRYRRRIITVVKIVPTKKAVDEEPVEYEEVEIDEANPDDEKYDPKEWETVEKTLPDGSKKRYRRRIITVVKIVPTKKAVDEEPLEYEEVEIDESNPEDEKYDPKEWETVEKTLPDGSKKRYRRRIITVVKIVPTKKAVDEEPVEYEEVEIDEANPDDEKYDPKEWETVEKTLPDGSKKRYRRRIITVVKIVPTKKAVDEEPVEYEEVEIDESNPDDDKYDPKDWEVIEKVQPNGSKKRYRRRIIVVVVVKKPEELVNENEVHIEEMLVNESTPEDDEQKYDPEEWETIEKLDDDGKVNKYRRRIAIVKIIRKSDDEPVNEDDCKVEEVPYDEANPQDDLYDPDEWQTIERPRSDGTVKKYRRRLYIIKVVKKPSPENEDGVNYEEEEITDDDDTLSDPDKYDPEEWEELVKTQPDGTVKRYRRRIIVVKFVKGHDNEDGGRPVIVDEQPIEYEEIEIEENTPDFESALDDPEYEVVQKRRPDGTIVRVKRRIIRVVVVKRPDGEKSPVVEEEPVEYEEVELDENSQDFIDALDDPECEIIEKKKDDGTVIRVRRRAMKVTVRHKPVRMTITSHPVTSSNKEPVAEDDLSYEEIEVDQNSPVHYDKNIWEEYDKVQPDGSVKRVRRRYISKCNVILKKPSFAKKSDVVDDVSYEEVELDDNDKSYDPSEWEIVTKEQPDGTKKSYRRRIVTTMVTTTYTTTRYVINQEGDEQTVMEDKPIETTQTFTFVDGQPIGTSEMNDDLDGSLSPLETTSMSMDDLISEINQMSLSLDHPSNASDRKPVVVETETITEQISVPVESSAVEEPAIDEEELKRRAEAERLEQEGLNATIDSIFTLDEEEVKSPHRHSIYEYDEAAYNESFDHELDEYGIDLQLEDHPQIEGDDIHLPDPSKPKVKPKKAPKPKRRQSSKGSVDDLQRQSSKDMTSGSDADDVNERRKSSARDEQSDYRPHSGQGNSQIIYTVTDVSQVEQGRGGFVSAVRAKHENLANDPSNSPRSSRVFDSPPSTPKGHVPTQTISFNEDDLPGFVLTNDPPSVPAKPTVIVPDESELPEEEFIFKTNQWQEESHPDMEQVVIEATDVPEVETEVVFISEIQEDKPTVAPRGSEPGSVRTRPFVLPRQDTQVIKTEIIEVDLTPSQHMESFTEDDDDRELSMSTEQLPTEVITKTITIEGDSTELTAEEIQKLLMQAPEEIGDLENYTTTQVVRTTTVQKTITGKTFTVTGDADDEEMQRMLSEAVSSEMSQTTTTDADGNIIITAIRDETIVVSDNDDEDGTEI